MLSILDRVETWVVYPFEKARLHIPDREKHLNVIVFTVLALISSRIPLWRGIVADSDSEISFKVFGTLMQLGTQPFVFASMVGPFLFKEPRKLSLTILGFLLSCFMSIHWGWMNGSIIGCVELMAMSFILLNAEVYLEDRSLISPTTSLLFANGCSKILLSAYFRPISFLWTWVLALIVTWIEHLSVTVSVNHTRHRHQGIGIELPVMYNSTTALVIYYTIFETFAHWYSPFKLFLASGGSFLLGACCVCLGVYLINGRLASINNTSGADLISKWKKQKYTLKGWRDPKRMSRHVQNLIDRNVHWNTIFICVLWILGTLSPPSVGVTTLFIMINTVKRHRKTLF